MKINISNLRKYNKFVILVFFLIFSATLLIYKNIPEKNTQETEFKVFDVDPAFADTTLKYLTPGDKAGQMIVVDLGNTDNFITDSLTELLYKILPGGVVFNTDSLTQFVRYEKNIQKFSNINPFVLLKTDASFINFKDTEKFPNIDILDFINSDSVKVKYVKSVLEIYNLLNTIPVIENNTKNCKSFKNEILLNNIFISGNKLWFADFSNYNFKDSLKLSEFKKFIVTGLSVVILDEKVSSELIYEIKSKFNFKGLIIKRINKKDENPDSLEKLLNAGADIFISENPEQLKRILTQLISNEVSANIIDAKIRKILLAKTFSGLNIKKQFEKEKFKGLLESPNIKISRRTVFKKSVTVVKNENNIIPFKNLRNQNFKLLVIGNTDLPAFKKVLKSYASIKSYFINTKNNNSIEKLKTINKTGNIITAFADIKADTNLVNLLFENNKAKTNIAVNFGNTDNLRSIQKFSGIIQAYDNSESSQHFAADAVFGGITVNGKLPCHEKEYFLSDASLTIEKIRVSECLPEEVGLNSNILHKIDSVANDGIRKGAFPGCQIIIFKNGYNVYNKAFGYHTYSKIRKVKTTDLYDLASVTKIAATTTAAMKLYDLGHIKLTDKLGRFFRDTKIDYSNIKPDTVINTDTLKITEIKDIKKLLKFQDTLHINDTTLIAFDTLIVTITPKNNIFQAEIRDLLLHKSGITPTLPILPYVIFKKNFYDSLEIIKQKFYDDIKEDTTLQNEDTEFNPKKELQKIYDTYFSHRYIKDTAETKIAENFYFRNNWFDTLWRETKRLKVYSRKIYQYSDINMILLQSAIDTLNKRSMNSYMRNTFYLPMGLKTMCYKPLRYFPKNRIIPTEEDKYWREQLLRGYVHDPSAAILGGISGNAGLFSDAYDLAILGQMWLNGGKYGGISYISKNVVNKFTGFQKDSHRGLGFDKKHQKTIAAKDAPPETFGHTGFTGTCIWVDPVNEIIFVFLSNRVNPSAKNWRINKLKIRQKIHQLIYDAMKNEN